MDLGGWVKSQHALAKIKKKKETKNMVSSTNRQLELGSWEAFGIQLTQGSSWSSWGLL